MVPKSVGYKHIFCEPKNDWFQKVNKDREIYGINVTDQEISKMNITRFVRYIVPKGKNPFNLQFSCYLVTEHTQDYAVPIELILPIRKSQQPY